MTASYQRVKELGFDMALAVGQHTNDRELSYYAMTPSGFEWEVGWNPIVVDEKTWEPTTYQGISIWGHTREGQTIIEKLSQFKTAAHSLLHREDTVPALAQRRHTRRMTQEATMLRIDTHHHVIPPDYRKALQTGPGCSKPADANCRIGAPETSLQAMAELDIGTAILSVSTPGTAFLPDPADAAALARDVNDYTAELAAAQPDRFGFFATVPLPNIDESVAGDGSCTRRPKRRRCRAAGQ